jgi:cell division protein FtsB
MTVSNKPLVMIRRAAGPALGLIVIGYFVAAAVIGDNGVMSWGEYRQAKNERQAQLATLKAEESQLSHRSNLLNPKHTDPDLAEEITKRELGVMRSDEVVVPLD